MIRWLIPWTWNGVVLGVVSLLLLVVMLGVSIRELIRGPR